MLRRDGNSTGSRILVLISSDLKPGERRTRVPSNLFMDLSFKGAAKRGNPMLEGLLHQLPTPLEWQGRSPQPQPQQAGRLKSRSFPSKEPPLSGLPQAWHRRSCM
mmetsp:Transcript_6005/g.13929  ORF Transcript_6005/g.13929 Transcript_6005/m.13929 type:complete len:105 (+) Transcript_6005:738-1052(+)